MVPLGYWSKLMTILVVFQFSFPGPCGFGMTWSIRVHIRTFKECGNAQKRFLTDWRPTVKIQDLLKAQKLNDFRRTNSEH
jgi:hypothetical protein